MNEFSGSFTGHARALTVLSLTDVPGHELQTVEIAGPQSSTDEKWNTARVTYWGVGDVVAGNGSQRGYFLNEHPDGTRNWGTFDGKITTSDNKTKVERGVAVFRWYRFVCRHKRPGHVHDPPDFTLRCAVYLGRPL